MIQTKKELALIVSILSYALAIDKSELTGIRDTYNKLWACYMAKRVTNYSNRQIAAFFNIHPIYMQIQIEHAAVGFLINDPARNEMEKLCLFYLDLQTIGN